MRSSLLYIFCLLTITAMAQSTVPPAVDLRHYDIINSISAKRIESDIRALVGFGTRHTLSDTVSTKRGIGAARRWIENQFVSISAQCGNCLEVSFDRNIQSGDAASRVKKDTEIVNVIAIQRGSLYPDRYIIMSADIDSRVSDVLNATADSPGANDNASGMAGTMEAARVLSKYKFAASIMYVGLSGEEQGLMGGKFLAQKMKAKGWDIIGVINNDMIGNIEGVDGIIANNSFRVFSEPTPVTESEGERKSRRFAGGEVDGISRQLARYVERMTATYFTDMEAKMIYRLDRFGRGGHHRPFNDEGYAGVRLMETHENYTRQHQDLRTENGIKYGDVIEGVNFGYAAKLTGVNAIVLAGLARAPKHPAHVLIGGAVRPSTTLKWDDDVDTNRVGYKLYWRETTSSQWEYSRYVGEVNEYTLDGVIIDNYFFGVASVAADGNESLVVFPSGLIGRE